MVNFFRKYHKWLGLFFTLVFILFAISGIVLNHRELVSSVDVNRNWLPENYRYNEWNNAAVAGTCHLEADSVLIYGNIGVWLTDERGEVFAPFNAGFDDGVDNHKVSKVLKMNDGRLYAGTYFGLFQFHFDKQAWFPVEIPVNEKRISDIISRGDSLLVLTRSYLLVSEKNHEPFKKVQLPSYAGYDNKADLFKTLWIIHSGELLGLPGKLLVDAIGLIFIFLTLTGLIYWMVPFIKKHRKTHQAKKQDTLLRLRRFSLKWHNKIGWTTLVLLVITSVTGMFLRPPLLAAVFNVRVGKIPYSMLDTPNPWHDKLRRIVYDQEHNLYYVATLEGIFIADAALQNELQPISGQPPVSVMGVNVFELVDPHTLLVGSFEGLFLWDVFNGYQADYIKKAPVEKKAPGGPPLGEFLVTAYTNDFNRGELVFDFDKGVMNLSNSANSLAMPESIRTLPMSLWNVALEVHTARIYQPLVGSFYILIVPLTGLVSLFILISGFVVWYVRFRKHGR
ncbi:MAG: PepSY domain-containing protein [Bacteroidetes bacterium]|nr:PepSY domain-containing protein [Bacteroidota bacterium]